MIRIPTHQPPTHPGEMLEEEFLVPHGMTHADLAARIGVDVSAVDALTKGAPLTPEMGLRLARFFDTSPDFWISGQVIWDVYHILHSRRASEIDRITPLAASA